MKQVIRDIQVVAEVTDTEGALHPVAVHIRARDLDPEVLTLLRERANDHILPTPAALADDTVLGG